MEEKVKLEIIDATVSGGSVVNVGDVIEVSKAEAAILLNAKRAKVYEEAEVEKADGKATKAKAK